MRSVLAVIMATLISVVASYAQELTILHVNDTHSHIDPQRSGEYAGRGGVIEQAVYIDSVRAAEGRRNVLLLHAGDFGQGTSYFKQMNGDIEIDVMNAHGFDVVCLGNHEFDNGVDELARRLADLDADVVCSNYDFSSSALEKHVKPYVIVRRAGLKIGIFGLLTDISKVVEKSIADAFEYQDPAEVANRYAAFLRDEKKCDMVICLSHLGYEEDKELASAVRNMDLIVGGHTHTLLHKKQIVKDPDDKDVVVVQNWKWGLNVGHLSVKY